MEIYRKGPRRFNSERQKSYAEIHDMADKNGWVGKEISLNLPQLTERGISFENLKTQVAKASLIMDEYLKGCLPNYFYSFSDPEHGNKASLFFFMEEVKRAKRIPPTDYVDHFLYRCCKMFLETKTELGGFGVDLNKLENLEYGTTISNPNPKLYLIDFYPTYFNMPAAKLVQQISEFAKAFGGPVNFPRVNSIIHQIK